MIYEESLWEKLKSSRKPIVCYGTGDGADKLFEICRKKGIEIKGVFASDDFARGQMFRGFKVETYSKTKEKFGEMVILLAFAAFKTELVAKIAGISRENELLAPSLPLFGGEIFDKEYFLQNREAMESVFMLLADDLSKQVYENIINFRLSGKAEYLFSCETPKSEVFENIVRIKEKDVFLDLGAYDGDTALEFSDISGGNYGKMFLFEPNPKILPKLENNTSHLRDTEIFPFAAWDRDEELVFDNRSGRGAHLSPSGKAKIRGIRPDSIVSFADHIKFDVEGAEKEALSGVSDIIKKHRPSLWVSAYHKTDDIFTIPRTVLSVCGEYSVYLRHHPYIPDWDTVYYFVKR